LVWVERGIDLDRQTPRGSTTGYDLAKLHRELLTRLSRADEALDAVWADFRKHPSKYTYDELMKYVPAPERSAWHEKAMEAAKGADLRSLMELLLDTREMEPLAELVRGATDETLERLSHYTTEPAAEQLEKSHPGLAARLWRAQPALPSLPARLRVVPLAPGPLRGGRARLRPHALAEPVRQPGRALLGRRGSPAGNVGRQPRQMATGHHTGGPVGTVWQDESCAPFANPFVRCSECLRCSLALVHHC